MKARKGMLYPMVYKNILFIVKQIFDINDDYEMNVHHGDTLKLNIHKKWNIKKKKMNETD